jgi:hypothetical protein
MNLDNKLKNLPPILYQNLDHRVDRRENMETQFKNWGITDYTRISTSRFSVDKIDEWKHNLDLMLLTPSDASIVMNQFTTIIDWYNSGISEYCIIMQDDMCLDLIEYWRFDWDYLMKNLPYNWDCVQLYFCHYAYIPMHLKPRMNNCSSGACYLINRLYAEKLIKLHVRPDGGFKLNNSLKDCKVTKECYSSDDFLIYQIGINYTLPVFCLNQQLSQDPDNKPILFPGQEYTKEISVHHNKMYDMLTSHFIRKWWVHESHKYSLDDFFTYNKSNDYDMTITVPSYNRIFLSK